MRSLLLITLLFVSLTIYSQEEPCNTPCGYCNCEELEGEASINSSAFLALGAVAGCTIAFIFLRKK